MGQPQGRLQHLCRDGAGSFPDPNAEAGTVQVVRRPEQLVGRKVFHDVSGKLGRFLGGGVQNVKVLGVRRLGSLQLIEIVPPNHVDKLNEGCVILIIHVFGTEYDPKTHLEEVRERQNGPGKAIV